MKVVGNLVSTNSGASPDLIEMCKVVQGRGESTPRKKQGCISFLALLYQKSVSLAIDCDIHQLLQELGLKNLQKAVSVILGAQGDFATFSQYFQEKLDTH